MKKLNITIEGKTYEVEVEEVSGAFSAPEVKPAASSSSTSLTAPAAAVKPVSVMNTQPAANEVRAPMPGTILEVKVVSGQKIRAGEVLCILEAMKMENEIVAPKDGTIEQVAVSKGAKVATGELLISLASQ